MSIVGAFPITLTNGSTADANQVMTDLNFIASQVNTNALALAGGALTGALTSSSSAAFTGQLSGGGTTTNDDAPAGNIGGYLKAETNQGGAVVLATGTPANVLFLDLTAGDWDVYSLLATNPNGAAVTSSITAALSTISATLPAVPNAGAYLFLSPTANAGQICVSPVGQRRYSLAAPTRIYLVAQIAFSSALAAYGVISARRPR